MSLSSASASSASSAPSALTWDMLPPDITALIKEQRFKSMKDDKHRKLLTGWSGSYWCEGFTYDEDDNRRLRANPSKSPFSWYWAGFVEGDLGKVVKVKDPNGEGEFIVPDFRKWSCEEIGRYKKVCSVADTVFEDWTGNRDDFSDFAYEDLIEVNPYLSVVVGAGLVLGSDPSVGHDINTKLDKVLEEAAIAWAEEAVQEDDLLRMKCFERVLENYGHGNTRDGTGWEWRSPDEMLDTKSQELFACDWDDLDNGSHRWDDFDLIVNSVFAGVVCDLVEWERCGSGKWSESWEDILDNLQGT